MPAGTRSLPMDAALPDEAEALGVDIAGTAWRRENRAAIEAWNEWTEKHGLPLEKYRRF